MARLAEVGISRQKKVVDTTGDELDVRSVYPVEPSSLDLE
jgi:hypothetical protein